MRSKKQRAALAALVIVLAFSIWTTCAFAQEHPTEHPTKGHKAAETVEITKEALSGAITAYVKGEAAKHEGYFPFHDEKDGVDLFLTLDKVHEERLARISEDTYFACADFKSKDGAMYDLDIFMKGTSAGDLKMTDITIHKKNGKERYTWREESGLWKRKEIQE